MAFLLVCIFFYFLFYCGFCVTSDRPSWPVTNGTLVGYVVVFVHDVCIFCLAYPYYIPPSVFSLRYGGDDSGTVNALLDLFGFTFVAPFSVGGAALSEEKNGWGYVWLFMLSQKKNIEGIGLLLLN